MQGRQILIPGGLGGLGVHVTAAFVRAGARVTIPAFERSGVDSLREMLGSEHDTVEVVDADFRNEEDVRRVVDDMPKLDVLVQLVGGFAMGNTETFEVAQMRAQLELNLVTTFMAVKHALRRMQQAGYGRIVTVGSRVAEDPPGKMAAYAAAKAGVVALTRAVAEETRGTGITANCVLVSTIDTPANRAAMGTADAHRWVAPSNLAAHILHLSSEAAGSLRGTALRVYADA